MQIIVFLLFFFFLYSQRQAPQRTPDIEHVLEVSLEDMYTGTYFPLSPSFPVSHTYYIFLGTTRKLEFNQRVVCDPCGGKGTTDKTVNTICSTCNGSGVEVFSPLFNPSDEGNNLSFQVKVVQFGPGMMTQAQQVCSKCGGEGEVIPKQHRCKSCNGQKVVSQPKRLDITIEPVLPSLCCIPSCQVL